MATRIAQLTPETIADIQAQLERGLVRDFADLCDRMIQREPDILGPMESRLSVISGSQMLIEPAEPIGDEIEDALAVEGAAGGLPTQGEDDQAAELTEPVDDGEAERFQAR